MSSPAVSTATPRRRMSGPGMVLVIVYAILALAGTGRSIYQIVTRFDEAPLAYTLSALAAVVYIVATVALFRRWDGLAWVTIGFEMVGVLVVGTLSIFAPSVLGMPSGSPFGPHATVWSAYGAGYLLIPLILPVLGLLWLARGRRQKRTGS